MLYINNVYIFLKPQNYEYSSFKSFHYDILTGGILNFLILETQQMHKKKLN